MKIPSLLVLALVASGAVAPRSSLAPPTPLRAAAGCAPSAPIGVSFTPGQGGAIEVRLAPTVEAGEPRITLLPRGAQHRGGALSWSGAGSRTVWFAVPLDGPKEVEWSASMEFGGRTIEEGGSLWIGAGEIPADRLEGAVYGDGFVTIQGWIR